MPLAPPSLATAAPAARRADVVANSNWRANRAALADTQPTLISRLDGPTIDVTWLYGRDGALTAQDPTGGWWAGCSVPAAAAEAMLRTMTGSGTVACFLRPPTAAAVRVGLDRLRRNQAIVALLPDLDAARILLHCESFATDILDHRLWLAIGEQWESELATLFGEREGLPTPSQFIRLTDGNEDLAEAMIKPAQQVFTEIAQQRNGALAALHHSSTFSPSRACVIAPTHFRLWDDAGHALSQLAEPLGGVHVDPDDPAFASPLAIARAALGSGAVIMPNTARADLPNVIPMSKPWITWLTGPRVPAFAPAGPHDQLLVADPAWRDGAIRADWPPARVHVATWPDAEPLAATATQGPLLILADLQSLDPSSDVVDMSSHRLLWDAIAEELVADPFALGNSILDYLHARMARMAIAHSAIDARRFIDDLIVPAYARGLAELLHRNRLPLRVAGEGWDRIESLKGLATGPVTTRERFRELVAASSALVHAWPTHCGHPIDRIGRPVVRAAGGRESFLRDARTAVAGGTLAIALPAAPPLSTDLLNRFIP